MAWREDYGSREKKEELLCASFGRIGRGNRNARLIVRGIDESAARANEDAIFFAEDGLVVKEFHVC